MLEGGTEEDIEALKKQKIEDESIEEVDKSEEEKDGEGDDDKKTMQLHKTQSVFLRNVAPNVSQAEIEEVCHTSIKILTKYFRFASVVLASSAWLWLMLLLNASGGVEPG